MVNCRVWFDSELEVCFNSNCRHDQIQFNHNHLLAKVGLTIVIFRLARICALVSCFFERRRERLAFVT